VRRRRAALILATLPVLAAGCGNAATRVPDVSIPAAPRHWVPANPPGGVHLRIPSNWDKQPATGPMIAAVFSGRATVALWRYPRSEPLPSGAATLRAAEKALVATVRRRDPTFRLAAARTVRVGGARAVELLGTETINGRRVRVRSTHVYAGGSELVIDAYAPPARFAALDRSVFVPLTESVRIDPAPAAGG
jgi:hypothetical protein